MTGLLESGVRKPFICLGPTTEVSAHSVGHEEVPRVWPFNATEKLDPDVRELLSMHCSWCVLDCGEPHHAKRYPPLLRLRLGAGPGGLGWNSSTSERLSRVFPPIDRVPKRRFRTRPAIDWRVTPRSLAASAWEIHWSGSTFLFIRPAVID